MCKIIFVCTGNTCRSPMAAALATSLLTNAGINATVISAGVGAWGGEPASKNAVTVMKAQGLDLEAHRSQPTTRELLESATLVLTMTRGHLTHVSGMCPTVKAFTLGEYAGCGSDISDPFGGNEELYRTCGAQIKALLESCIAKFREDLI